MQKIVLAVGNRCAGIDHMLDYVYEYLIKSKRNIEFTLDFERIKNKAYEQLDMNSFSDAGFTIGYIFGQFKLFCNNHLI